MRFGTVRVALALAAVTSAALALPASAGADLRAFDASRESNLYDVTHTWSATVGDYNGDGWDDAVVSNHYGKPARLYRNDHGRFKRVRMRPERFKVRDRHDCAFGDADGNGLLDIYCTIGGAMGTERHPNELFLQVERGRWDNQAKRYRVRDLNGRGRDTTFLDVENDGDMDLYVGNDYPRRDRFVSRNRLFINVNNDRFRDARGYGVNREVGGRSVQAIDYDGDGFQDLLVCGERHLYLYRNVGGERFRNATDRAGVNQRCESALLAPVDPDARPDLVRVSKRRLSVRLQRRDRSFGKPVYKRELDVGEEVAEGFVNRDERADLYVVQQGPEDRDTRDLMLINKRKGRHFARTDIPQTRAGKGDFAIGIDHDRNGRTDFIVMNGDRKARGPVRLIAFR